jgi:hypothetical protein
MSEQETTTTAKDIGRVLPGPCCGRFVPGPDEIETTLAELGIERTAEHPEFAMEPEEGFELEGTELDDNVLVMGAMHGMVNQLGIPSGTPRHFPPFLGATQHWSERTRSQVRRIRRKAPGIVCATYKNHGRTGEPWGIDIMVSPLHQMANDSQKHLGNALVGWLMNNIAEMHLNYVIWFNQMNDGAGWFSYEPFVGFGGDPNPVTQRHQDHVHVQVMNPLLGSFQ